MSNRLSSGSLDLGGLIGETGGGLRARLGRPATERTIGSERWLVFDGAGWSLRARLAPGDREAEPRVRSWTVSFERGFPDLDAACAALSIAPDPPLDADLAGDPRFERRSLPDPVTGGTHSLTATLRDGMVSSLTAFDEAPDWRKAVDGADG